MTNMETALMVAEKPSVAHSLKDILGRNQATTCDGRSSFNKIHKYTGDVAGKTMNVMITSVLGHLMEIDFTPAHRSWSSCPPGDLFEAPISKSVRSDQSDLERQLKDLARCSTLLVLWLDCDREGENICFEVLDVCRSANRNLRVKRARFSALIPREVRNALDNLGEPDEKAAVAVDTRSEIDLRLGAAFTRFMTKRFQSRFEQLSNKVISYGPCQFPTMGFVVERYLRRKKFVQEPFWYIDMQYQEDGVSGGSGACAFKWDRVRVFDHSTCFVLFDLCVGDGTAVVVSVDGRRKERWAPVPLATVELQKRSSRFLRMRSETTMQVAEELYNRGLISYPRTETDQFSPEFDIEGALREFEGNPVWGSYVTCLLHASGFSWPRNGGHSDQAHPPITPTKSVDPGSLNGDAKRVYELVVKHFIACCSKAAVGHETSVCANIGGEGFKASGLMISERNWLDVYAPWERWGEKSIPLFHQGQLFVPSVLQMKQSQTEPPHLLTESELIAEMDSNGIGTDATIAQHIKAVQDRDYIARDPQDRFYPTVLGLALVEGYQQIGYELSKPALRAAQEKDLAQISMGEDTKEAVISRCIDVMSKAFSTCQQRAHVLDEVLGKHFRGIGLGNEETTLLQGNFSRCGCGGAMELKERRHEGRARGRGGGERGHQQQRGGGRGRGGARKTDGYDIPPRLVLCGTCNVGLPLPRTGMISPIQPDFNCPICGYQVLSVSQGRGYEGQGYKMCPKCFRDPPMEHGGKEGESFRCFMCHATCRYAGRTEGQDTPLSPCTQWPVNGCSGHLLLKKTSNGSFRLSCSRGHPTCSGGFWLPRVATVISVAQSCCDHCCKNLNGKGDPSEIRKLVFQFKRSAVPPDVPTELEACPFCDNVICELNGGERPIILRPPNNLTRQQQRQQQQQQQQQQRSRKRNQTASASLSSPEATSLYGNALLGKAPARQHGKRGKGGTRESGAADNGGQQHLCRCTPPKPANLLTTRKPGPNQGRKFYKCHECNFFEWAA